MCRAFRNYPKAAKSQRPILRFMGYYSEIAHSKDTEPNNSIVPALIRGPIHEVNQSAPIKFICTATHLLHISDTCPQS
jgi:hypothetical protein